MILKLRDWISAAPNARSYNMHLGEWYSYSDTDASKYMSLTQVGGRKRDDTVRFPHYMLTIVGGKSLGAAERDASSLEMLAIMDDLIERSRNVPCGLVAVIPVGDVTGPMLTSGGKMMNANSRMAVTLTLEVITNE